MRLGRLFGLLVLLSIASVSACAGEPEICSGDGCDSTAAAEEPPAESLLAAQARQYAHNLFAPSVLGMALAFGTARWAERGPAGGRGYAEQISWNLARNGVAQSLEFATAALLRQRQGFAPSEERGFRRRARAALLQSFFATGPHGDALAFPRMAAVLGTPWAMRQWHPGRESEPNPWVESALLLGNYVARSYWTEFRPEITRAVRKMVHPAAPDNTNRLPLPTPSPSPAPRTATAAEAPSPAAARHSDCAPEPAADRAAIPSRQAGQ